MNTAAVALALLALATSACSIRPLPQDFAADSTIAIVKKIRCEARDALDRISVGLMREYGDERAHRLADAVEAGSVAAVELLDGKYRGKYLISAEGLALFDAYSRSAVTFDFALTGAEENDNTAQADFRLPVATGLLTVNANAGAKLGRKNVRKFQTTTSFFDLHRIDRKSCAKVEAQAANVVYPLTGRIGLQEAFTRFVTIDVLTGVTSNFTDTITFTTTLTGGITPKISLDPVSRQELRLAGASATLKATRVDDHQLTMSLARGERLFPLKDAIKTAKELAKENADQLRFENALEGPGRVASTISGIQR